jgi:hypothetical protein
VVNGPLIPGMREFDRPRRGWPRWLSWLLAGCGVLMVLVVVAGLLGGAGPLHRLGMSTTALQAIGYRPTVDDSVIQVSVNLPASGLCRDDEVEVVAFERGNRVEVESSLTRSRNTGCAVTTIGGDLRWVDVRLDHPLGSRTVIRTSDREPLPRDPTPTPTRRP